MLTILLFISIQSISSGLDSDFTNIFIAWSWKNLDVCIYLSDIPVCSGFIYIFGNWSFLTHSLMVIRSFTWESIFCRLSGILQSNSPSSCSTSLSPSISCVFTYFVIFAMQLRIWNNKSLRRILWLWLNNNSMCIHPTFCWLSGQRGSLKWYHVTKRGETRKKSLHWRLDLNNSTNEFRVKNEAFLSELVN